MVTSCSVCNTVGISCEDVETENTTKYLPHFAYQAEVTHAWIEADKGELPAVPVGQGSAGADKVEEQVSSAELVKQLPDGRGSLGRATFCIHSCRFTVL